MSIASPAPQNPDSQPNGLDDGASVASSSQGGLAPPPEPPLDEEPAVEGGGADAQRARAAAGKRRRRRQLEPTELTGLAAQSKRVFDEVKNDFLEFLQLFKSEPGTDPDYVKQASEMEDHDATTLFIDYQHMSEFNQELADTIRNDYYRFEPALTSALQNFIRDQIPRYVVNDRGATKEFYISFTNLPTVEKIRSLKTDVLGHLTAVQGTVTRTTETRPELIYGTFKCSECNAIVNDVLQQFKYTEPIQCANPSCENKNQWELDIQQSKFTDWQRVRVQENSNEIPAGSMPRSLEVIIRNEIVERVKPGDKTVFTGHLIVVPDVAKLTGSTERVKTGGKQAGGSQYQGVIGLKALGVRDLTYKLAFLANGISEQQQQYGSVNIRGEDDEDAGLTQEQRDELMNMSKQTNLYERLVESVAPSIFGHQDVKRGVLLMLFGGVHKSTPEGIKLRGDINVCVIGDPSTAKSQFLKYVTAFLPRAVYTSGKASSSAGLTASVVKDHETGEFGIEAGALMLADNGICCIDEFDKMDPKDQAAIHEAMEQQTISITKAGISATLNARTSILAAANPIYGRYDRTKTLRNNIDISAPIMSRFDLFFIILDECDEVLDYHVARHIVNIHQRKDEALTPEFTTDQLQQYIRLARTFKPQFTEETRKLLVKKYRELRGADSSGANKTSYRITVRQLESMVRLSEAIARLNLEPTIKPDYVLEAARLLKTSIISVHSEDVTLEDDEGPGDGDGGDGGDDDGKGDDDMDDGDDGAPKRKIQLSFQEYQKIANMLVFHLRSKESDDNNQGMRQQDLVDWYLNEKADSDEVDNEEDLEFQMKIASYIIKRLVEVDNVLIVIQKEDEGQNIEDRMLVVHPNYDPDTTQNQGPLEDTPEQIEEKKRKLDEQRREKAEKLREKKQQLKKRRREETEDASEYSADHPRRSGRQTKQIRQLPPDGADEEPEADAVMEDASAPVETQSDGDESEVEDVAFPED